MSHLAGWFLQVLDRSCQRLGTGPAKPLLGALRLGLWVADDQWPLPRPRSFITIVDEKSINSPLMWFATLWTLVLKREGVLGGL